MLDEAGSVPLEQRASTTPKAMKEVFGAMPRSRIALETGMRSPLEIIQTHPSPVGRSFNCTKPRELLLDRN
jgi:hypothetical protein